MNYNIVFTLGGTTVHTIGYLFTSEEEINKEPKTQREN